MSSSQRSDYGQTIPIRKVALNEYDVRLSFLSSYKPGSQRVRCVNRPAQSWEVPGQVALPSPVSADDQDCGSVASQIGVSVSRRQRSSHKMQTATRLNPLEIEMHCRRSMTLQPHS